MQKSSQKRKFLRKLSRKGNFRKTKFREISRKLPHFRMIFAFREKEKTVFVSTLLRIVVNSKYGATISQYRATEEAAECLIALINSQC
jgi:hypothetical protein